MHSKIIVMIGNTSWGMYHFRSDTIKEMLKRGHRVIVLAPQDEFSSKLTSIGCEYKAFELDRKGTNPLSEVSSIKTLVLLLQNIKPDTVINYTIKPAIYGTIAAKITGVKKIIAVTTGLGFVFSHVNFTTFVAKKLYKLVLKFADEVWFLNNEDEKIFLEHKLITKHKSFVLPGEGVNTDYYQRTSNPLNNMTFTLVSRMLWDKGVGIYAEAAQVLKSKYPDAIFQIVGPIDEGNPEGITLKQLKSWHDEGFVKYLGATSDIRPILERTSCLVHPTFYKEGLPRILLEACAMSIPCITTNTPGCKDVISDMENGFLVTPKSVESLVSAIEKFIHLNNSEKNSLILNSRNKVMKNFCSSAINEIYISKLGL